MRYAVSRIKGQRMQFEQLKRRDFLTIVGTAGVAWTLGARAQPSPGKLPTVGSIQTLPNENTEAFEKRLREAGYVNGQNMLLETRYHRGEVNRIDEFASELVALKCSVIFAAAPYAIHAALKATTTIPIVGIDLESDPGRTDGSRASLILAAI
jgi:putative ABC transport system substrate-binding protein